MLVFTRLAPARGFHSSALARSGADYHHLPFAIPKNQQSRAFFAAKLVSYVGLGFAIPFIAGFYQLNKSKGAAAE
ncbi:hypothetical protein C8J56DRAFT_1047371 [Mycena floridula]|nr:hypothetical protein C8J56DRAFT_1047371 [Mycena floridula]